MHHGETRSRRQTGKIIMKGNTLSLRLPLSVARTWQMTSRRVQVEQPAADWKAHLQADLTREGSFVHLREGRREKEGKRRIESKERKMKAATARP